MMRVKSWIKKFKVMRVTIVMMKVVRMTEWDREG